MGRYTIIDHTADVGLDVVGDTLEDAFSTTAEAMFELLWKTSDIKETEELSIELVADSLDQLVVDWLSEMIFIYETQGRLFRSVKVDSLMPEKRDSSLEGKDGGPDDTNDEVWYRIRSRLMGESLDLDKHEIKTEIKAVTYHMLKVDVETNRIVVLFDI